MVLPVRLVVIEVLEAGGIGVAKEERHKCVTIINSIQFLSFHVIFEIMFNNWVLSNSSGIGSSSFNINAVAKGEDILESFVLESVGVHINQTIGASNSRVN